MLRTYNLVELLALFTNKFLFLWNIGNIAFTNVPNTSRISKLYFCIIPVTYSLNQARTDSGMRDKAQFCMSDKARYLLICDAFLILSFLWHCIKLCSYLYPAASCLTLNPFILFSPAYLYAVCQTFLPVSGKPFLANLAVCFANSPSLFSFRTFGLWAPPLLWPAPFMMFFNYFLKDKYSVSVLIHKWCGWFTYKCHMGCCQEVNINIEMRKKYLVVRLIQWY